MSIMAAPALEFCQVTKVYGGRTVLASAEGTIAPGEVVVLLGPSGSGKSTLVTLAAGMDAPDSGTVLVAGQDLAALSEHDRTVLRRRRIGLVFQHYNLATGRDGRSRQRRGGDRRRDSGLASHPGPRGGGLAWRLSS